MKVTYSNKEWQPYSAADIHSMDQYVDYDFKGNVLEELLGRGFTVDEKPDFLGKYPLRDPQGREVARLIPATTPQERYDAANTTQVKLKFNLKTDADILKKLAEVENKQGYIKALIRADIASE